MKTKPKATLKSIKRKINQREENFNVGKQRLNEHKFANQYIKWKYEGISEKDISNKLILEASYAYWNLLGNCTHFVTLTFINNPLPITKNRILQSTSSFLNRVDRKFYGNKARHRNEAKRQRMVRRTYYETGKFNSHPHLHILLQIPKGADEQELYNVLESKFRRVKLARDIDIRTIYDEDGLLSYPVKELVELGDEILVPQLCA